MVRSAGRTGGVCDVGEELKRRNYKVGREGVIESLVSAYFLTECTSVMPYFEPLGPRCTYVRGVHVVFGCVHFLSGTGPFCFFRGVDLIVFSWCTLRG